MIGVLRSCEPHQHVQDLEANLPWKLEILTIWYGKGDRRKEVHQKLENFRADCPGGNWFHLNPQPASAVVSKILFDRGEDIEPGITLRNVDDDAAEAPGQLESF